jgi:hypothetical protein
MIKKLEESSAGWAKMQTDLELFDIRRVNGYKQGIDEEPRQKSEEDNKTGMKSKRTLIPTRKQKALGDESLTNLSAKREPNERKLKRKSKMLD